MKPLVLVRSGGDIASGVIYRLKRAGYPVIVNEIAIPTMIRREVSYGNAVTSWRNDIRALCGTPCIYDRGEESYQY